MKVGSYTYVESLSGDYCIRQLEVGGEMCYRSVHEPVIVSRFAQSKVQLVTHLYTDVNRCIPSIHVLVSKPKSNVLTASNRRKISGCVTGVMPVAAADLDTLWFPFDIAAMSG